jgi:hypothetical protein
MRRKRLNWHGPRAVGQEQRRGGRLAAAVRNLTDRDRG